MICSIPKRLGVLNIEIKTLRILWKPSQKTLHKRRTSLHFFSSASMHHIVGNAFSPAYRCLRKEKAQSLNDSCLGAGEQAQSAKCLPCKCEDLSSTPKSTAKNGDNSGTWLWYQMLQRQSQRVPGAQWSPSPASLLSSRPVKDPVSKKGGWCLTQNTWGCSLAYT